MLHSKEQAICVDFDSLHKILNCFKTHFILRSKVYYFTRICSNDLHLTHSYLMQQNAIAPIAVKNNDAYSNFS